MNLLGKEREKAPLLFKEGIKGRLGRCKFK